MNFLKNLGMATGNADTEEGASDTGEVGDVLERVLIARGGIPETLTVLYKNSKKEHQNASRYILRKSQGGGAPGTVAAATGNILHSAAVLAADAAVNTYVRPVLQTADAAATMVGFNMFHNADNKVHDTAVGAVDHVIVTPVVMAVSAIERLFGVGGDVEIIGEDSEDLSSQPIGRSSLTTNYKYAKLSADESSPSSSTPSSSTTIADGEEEEVSSSSEDSSEGSQEVVQFAYDSTYPLTTPTTIRKGVTTVTTFRVAIITDLDRGSRSSENTYISKLKTGDLTLNNSNKRFTVKWDKNSTILTSSRHENGRGMELSELNVFNGKLYASDDKTGVIFEVVGDQVKEFTRLLDGDGSVETGFKCEWGTVKDGILYIGSHGTPTLNENGEITDINHEWVKKVLPNGDVFHVNWHFNYEAIRRAVGVTSPGYIIHEACCWSDVHEKWFFLPRKIHPERYTPETDEVSCCNILISCDEDFREFEILEVGELQPSHGFSSFKFVPDSDDHTIVAIKTKETADETASYIMAFTVDGEILLEETEISAEKYEGIEFI